MGAELGLAMDRQRRGDAVVVPILLRPVDLQPEDAEDMPFVGLLSLQGLPRDLKPVTSWANRDEAWTTVASGLRATVKEIQARRPVARAVEPELESLWTPDDHPLLASVVGDVTQRIGQANAARGGPALDEVEVRTQARRLIDMRESRRVLWVDDHPANNAGEQAALAKLQIEVVAVRSTDDALAQLEKASRGDHFDLVISDWHRGDEGPLAGVRLISAMRGRGHAQPVIFYHGAFGTERRAAVAAGARAAGAFGEAVLPGELMALVLAALEA
jgi:CheY-like chemotaxis protein